MDHTETFDTLMTLDAPRESYEAFAIRAGVSSRAVRNFRFGAGKRPFRTTVAKLAAALGVEPARVLAAIAASRKAAGKD